MKKSDTNGFSHQDSKLWYEATEKLSLEFYEIQKNKIDIR